MGYIKHFFDVVYINSSLLQTKVQLNADIVSFLLPLWKKNFFFLFYFKWSRKYLFDTKKLLQHERKAVLYFHRKGMCARWECMRTFTWNSMEMLPQLHHDLNTDQREHMLLQCRCFTNAVFNLQHRTVFGVKSWTWPLPEGFHSEITS